LIFKILFSSGSDPYYTLLEILNPEESQNFTDHYMDIRVDFSNTIFILTCKLIFLNKICFCELAILVKIPTLPLY